MAKGRGGPDDPRGVIAEAYRIDGITKADCRSIFLDWALVHDGDPAPAVRRLLAGRGPHPMTEVLEEALAAPERTGRRGGRAARRRG